MNHPLSSVSVKQLQRAIKIKAKIEALRARLIESMGFGYNPSPIQNRRLSAAGRAAIAAGARKRWAKVNDVKQGKRPGRKKMSAAAKARMSAVAKARWAKAKAAGKTSL